MVRAKRDPVQPIRSRRLIITLEGHPREFDMSNCRCRAIFRKRRKTNKYSWKNILNGEWPCYCSSEKALRIWTTMTPNLSTLRADDNRTNEKKQIINFTDYQYPLLLLHCPSSVHSVRAISLRFVFRSRNSPLLRLHAVYMGHWGSTYSANPTKKN